MKHVLASGIAMLVSVTAAAANDSVATQGAGGLILVHAQSITMESEDLYVSPREVRVSYVFRNQAGEDRTHLVAFPMPQIDPQDYLESDISIPSPEADNFMDFSVKVGGEEIAPALEMRALSGGIEVTERLAALDVPLNPLTQAAVRAVSALPRADQESLAAMGAVIIDEDGARPAWSLRSTYYWQQTFPAAAPLAVSHRYVPAVGMTMFYYKTSVEDGALARAYCIDAGTDRAIRKKMAGQPKDNPYLMQSSIEYILTTGANWQGSIGDFRLVVDKLRSDAIVSFCMDGVKKIAPTQFEVRKKDFYPTQDLRILLLRAPPAE